MCTICHDQCQRVQTEIIKYETPKLSYIFGSKPNMKVHVQNLRVSFLKREAQNCLFSGVFCNNIANIFETRYRQMETIDF